MPTLSPVDMKGSVKAVPVDEAPGEGPTPACHPMLFCGCRAKELLLLLLLLPAAAAGAP